MTQEESEHLKGWDGGQMTFEGQSSLLRLQALLPQRKGEEGGQRKVDEEKEVEVVEEFEGEEKRE